MNRKWAFVDLVIVLVFVAIGRSAHHHVVSVAGLLSTTWPFAVGLAIGWLVVEWRRQDLASLRAGTEVLLCTVAFGMIVRVLAGQGTAFSFIVVALVFLGAFILGCRAARVRLARRFQTRSVPVDSAKDL